MPTNADAALGPVLGTTARADEFATAAARVRGGYDSTAAAVVGTLGAVLSADDPLPLLLHADAYSRWAARRFAARCTETSRRLRPSDSVGLETSELVRKFAIASGWRGPCYLLGGVSARRFLRIARRFAARGPVVLCDVLPLDPDALDDPGCAVTAVLLGGPEPLRVTGGQRVPLLRALAEEREARS
ncbi:hypothetical protein [Saccharopolyspora sp. CA-218241]|uniref:hypothetical protein n=1 Tax=Saccharopolyspora sp. CA-218241 TaxID=3240027 RepID=UPI003D969967